MTRASCRRSIRPSAGAGAGTTGGGGGPGSGPFIVIGLLLAIVVGGLAFLAWQRGPRTTSEPEIVWRSIVRLAGRFGFAPRPSQTVFEYTTALGEVLPNARPDLQTVARAKVEVAYGRGQLGDDRLRVAARRPAPAPGRAPRAACSGAASAASRRR